MNLVLEGRNVNVLWPRAVSLIHHIGEKSSSRAGDVLVAPHPVMSVYGAPCERVLFDETRDANPFFHLFECLWMMAGRRDAEFLNTFVKDFGDRFAEPNKGSIEGPYLWGAYGYRWKNWFSEISSNGEHQAIDQVERCIRRLREKPDDRRVVISMWDPTSDLYDPDDQDEEYGEPKDLPCNTHIYLRVQGDRGQVETGHGNVEDYDNRVLDMTVCCRSNDIVWGAYGANAVHFSFLQEYIAGRLGVAVGRLYQLSNNWHAYLGVLKKYVDRSGAAADTQNWNPPDLYNGGHVSAMPIGTDWREWDRDLASFMKLPMSRVQSYANPWFSTVAVPMYRAHAAWRDADPKNALDEIEMVAASDWYQAARSWLIRRADAKGALR